MSNSVCAHGLHHARLPCPSLSVRFAQIHVHWVSDAIQPSHPLLPPSPPAPNLSQHKDLLQWVSSLHQRAKLLELQHQSFQWFRLISFRIDWFDLAVQGTVKSLLQHNSKAWILQCSAFFMVQLSHPYMTTGKTIALASRTFVSKVMSLVFNMLSRFVIAFFQGAGVLISWLQSPSTVILKPRSKQISLKFILFNFRLLDCLWMSQCGWTRPICFDLMVHHTCLSQYPSTEPPLDLVRSHTVIYLGSDD